MADPTHGRTLCSEVEEYRQKLEAALLGAEGGWPLREIVREIPGGLDWVRLADHAETCEQCDVDQIEVTIREIETAKGQLEALAEIPSVEGALPAGLEEILRGATTSSGDRSIACERTEAYRQELEAALLGAEGGRLLQKIVREIPGRADWEMLARHAETCDRCDVDQIQETIRSVETARGQLAALEVIPPVERMLPPVLEEAMRAVNIQHRASPRLQTRPDRTRPGPESIPIPIPPTPRPWRWPRVLGAAGVGGGRTSWSVAFGLVVVDLRRALAVATVPCALMAASMVGLWVLSTELSRREQELRVEKIVNAVGAGYQQEERTIRAAGLFIDAAEAWLAGLDMRRRHQTGTVGPVTAWVLPAAVVGTLVLERQREIVEGLDESVRLVKFPGELPESEGTASPMTSDKHVWISRKRFEESRTSLLLDGRPVYLNIKLPDEGIDGITIFWHGSVTAQEDHDLTKVDPSHVMRQERVLSVDVSKHAAQMGASGRVEVKYWRKGAPFDQASDVLDINFVDAHSAWISRPFASDARAELTIEQEPSTIAWLWIRPPRNADTVRVRWGDHDPVDHDVMPDERSLGGVVMAVALERSTQIQVDYWEKGEALQSADGNPMSNSVDVTITTRF